MISFKTVLEPLKVSALIMLLALAFGAPVVAEDDLSDPAVCMDCHDDADRDPPSDPTRPQVHNPAGGFFQEAHADFTCIDCHTYIKDLEHDEYAPGQQVDCTECHDETPTK
jgi:hypothetical protein